MKKNLLLVLLLLVCVAVRAQYDYEDEDFKKKPPKPPRETGDRKFDPSKLSLGGFAAASFGDIIYVDISPVVAYRFTDRLALGAGAIYQYLNWRAYNYPPPYNTSHTYGGRVFPRVFLWRELFIQPEYMLLNTEITVDYGGSYTEYRENFHNIFAGAGYNFPISDRAYFTILASVNLTT